VAQVRALGIVSAALVGVLAAQAVQIVGRHDDLRQQRYVAIRGNQFTTPNAVASDVPQLVTSFTAPSRNPVVVSALEPPRPDRRQGSAIS
jgi:hypothetical protein